MRNLSLLRIFNLFLVGLLAGAMMEEYFIVKIAMAELSKEQWGIVHARFGRFHPFTIIPIAALSTLSIIFILMLERKINSPGKRVTWIAAGLFAIIIILTGSFMMPLNFAIEGWETTGIPDNWKIVRDDWIFYQGWRTLLSVSGFLLLIIALRLSAGHRETTAAAPGKLH